MPYTQNRLVEHSGDARYRPNLTRGGEDPLDELIRNNPTLEGFLPLCCYQHLTEDEYHWASIVMPQHFGGICDTPVTPFYRRRALYDRIAAHQRAGEMRERYGQEWPEGMVQMPTYARFVQDAHALGCEKRPSTRGHFADQRDSVGVHGSAQPIPSNGNMTMTAGEEVPRKVAGQGLGPMVDSMMKPMTGPILGPVSGLISGPMMPDEEVPAGQEESTMIKSSGTNGNVQSLGRSSSGGESGSS